tara:strand:- start:42 stop:254 length:213 start_codon:yes stop_codon:yes gene_type:complete
MVKFEKLDKKDWEKFRLGTKQVITNAEYKMVCQLHSKYYQHKYNEPCTCNPRQIVRWIKDLNIVWDNGDK